MQEGLLGSKVRLQQGRTQGSGGGGRGEDLAVHDLGQSLLSSPGGALVLIGPQLPRFSHRKRTWPGIHLAMVSWAKPCPLPSSSGYKTGKPGVRVINAIALPPCLLGR